MKVVKARHFSNGSVFAASTEDGYPVEFTDTFLPTYTKDAIGEAQNKLKDYHLGTRSERWMVGVSCMSGCPVRCKFCATGQLKRYRRLTSAEIVEQVKIVLDINPDVNPAECDEFKINYTRMGEPFLNIDEIKDAILEINALLPGVKVHHYISTIGVKGSDFSWVEGDITLQISLHSLDEEKRDWLIPYAKKMSIEELGKIRTASNLKTTINLTLVDESDFDIDKLREHFDPEFFFVKLSPINTNCISEENSLGSGLISELNLR